MQQARRGNSKNKFVSKSATCKIVFELGIRLATFQAQARQVRQIKQACGELEMNAKKDFNTLSNELIAIVNNTAGIDSTVAAWWVTRLNGVIKGTDKGLTNPQGYFLNGIAPASRRCQGNVKALFIECLLAGYTSNAEVKCRTVNEFSQRMMQKGLFESFARSESQYGDKESRLTGAKVSHTTMPVKAKKEASKQVVIMADAKDNNLNAKAFEASQSLAMIIAKYSKPETSKVAKPETTKPEVEKKAARNPKAA